MNEKVKDVCPAAFARGESDYLEGKTKNPYNKEPEHSSWDQGWKQREHDIQS